ncbi:MAG TPA: carboxypeptidase regulatory-like domain-containing protein [Terriglobales bacterium]|nr:carboxypeptidase regulatory-like domain-containing protein [Terriglobales bacterium]
MFNKRVILSVIVVVAMCVGLFAQSGTSRVTGTIQDRTGAVIPGAKVTLTNEATNVAYTTTSTSTGSYTFEGVQSGTYSITAEMANFKKFVSNANILSVGQPLTVNALLDVGMAGEVVNVTGSAELVSTSTSGNFGTTIENVSLAQLPIIGLRGRNALSLVALVPGVQEGGIRCNSGGCSSVHGSRDRAWNYTLDGVDTNETSAGGAQLSPARINPDSIAEFRVITGQTTAEYGRNVGGQVTIVTKSGTNNFHGNGFWYYQTPAITANAYTNKAATPQIPRPQFVQNIYGGSLGGPIIKNKTFFFGNIQLLHAVNSSTVTRTVYTDTLKNTGIFRFATTAGTRNRNAGEAGASVDAAGNPIVPFATYDINARDLATTGGVGLDTLVRQFLALAPSPNNFSVGDGLNTAGFTFSTPQLEKQVDVIVKVDHNFNPNNSLFVRYAGGHQNTLADTANAGQPPFPGLPASVNTLRRPRNVAVNWRWNPTTKMTNELIFGVNRFAFQFLSPTDDPLVQAAPFNFNLVTQPLNTREGNSRYLTSLQLADNISRVAGAHTFKGGINFRYARHIDHRGSIGALNAMPQVTFSTGSNPVNRNPAPAGYGITALTNLNTSDDRGRLESAINDLLGRIGQIQQGYVAASDSAFKPAPSFNVMDHRWGEYDFYFQDTWKVFSNLTVDLGLRLEARTAPNLVSFKNLVPNQPVTFGSPATSTVKWVEGKFFNDDWNNIGPSIGFAWDPYKDGKTAIRGSYRLAYDRINTFSFSSSVFQGMPGLTFQLIDSTSGPAGVRAKNWAIPVPTTTPAALQQLPASGLGSITVADPNMRTPKVNMFGFSFEREIMKNTVLTLQYNGRHGVGLYGAYNANQADIRGNGFLAEFIKIKADPTYNSALFNQIFSADTRRGALTGTAWARSSAGFGTSFNQNNVAGLAQTISTTVCTASTCTAGNSGVPLLVASGMPLTFFQPFSQVRGGMIVLDTNDYSNYHALTAQVERRFANGLLYQASWTWSKAMDVRSFDPTFTIASTTGGSGQASASTPFDKGNPRLNYAPSDMDRKHVFQGNWVYELPFGKGKRWGGDMNRAVDAIIGGWSFSGAATWQTGRPATFYGGSSTFSSVNQTPVSCTGPCDPYYGSVFRDGAAGNHQFYFPTVGAFNATTNCRTLGDGSQLCIPGPGEFSNIGRNYFRQGNYANLDLSIGKDFKIIEGHSLQARVQMQNATNSQMYDFFGSFNIQSGLFTRLKQDSDGVRGNDARRMQLALKYTF